MAHVLEAATTGRSQCRACGRKIDRGELRFGERRDNAFGEGESTLWFHPLCAAYTRPDAMLELLNTATIADSDALRAAADVGHEHERLPRLKAAERAPTGRASCRQCHQPIEKGAWRLGLIFFEEFRFNPGGFIHASCARDYFGTAEITDRVQHFTPELTPEELQELVATFSSGSSSLAPDA